MLEEGIFDMKRFAEGGWVTALKYEDEIIDDLKVRTAGDAEKEKEKVGEGAGWGMGVAVGTLSLQSRLHNE